MAGFLLLSIILLVLGFSFKKNKVLLLATFIVLFIISGFRSISVGTDTENYLMLFTRIQNGIEIRTELLWGELSKLVVFFGGNFDSMVQASTLLVLLPVYISVKKYSINPLMSIFFYYTLYFYFTSMNITRQMIAVSLVLFACTFLLKNEKRWFVLFVFIASGFHLTALTCLPLLFADKLPDKNKVYYLTLAIAMFTGLFLSNFIFTTAANIFGYMRFVEEYELGTILGNFFYLLLLNAFFIFILKCAKERKLLFKLFFISIIVSNLLVRIPFGDRVMLFFTIIQILYLPYFIYNNKINPKQLTSFIVILFTFVMFFRKFGAGEILPYSNTLF